MILSMKISWRQEKHDQILCDMERAKLVLEQERKDSQKF